MIHCNFITKNGVLVGFELKGHAGASRTGQDIVCAAVSSATYMTVNTITEIYGFSPALTENDGLMRVTLSVQNARRCHELLQGFRLHLIEIQKQYPCNIKVH